MHLLCWPLNELFQEKTNKGGRGHIFLNAPPPPLISMFLTFPQTPTNKNDSPLEIPQNQVRPIGNQVRPIGPISSIPLEIPYYQLPGCFF